MAGLSLVFWFNSSMHSGLLLSMPMTHFGMPVYFSTASMPRTISSLQFSISCVSLVSQTTGWSVYTITTKSGKLNLRSGPGTNYKRLGQYAKGKEVALIAKTNDSWYEVTAPDGKRGYMSTDYLTFARTEGSSTTATGQVVEPRQVRDQPFRIYRVVPTLTQVEVYARHIFYDLMDNMILSYKPEGPVGGTTAAHAVLDRCESVHDFTMYTDLTTIAKGWWANANYDSNT